MKSLLENFFLKLVLPFIIIIAACSTSQVNLETENYGTVPDYDKPESQFVQLNFFSLTSDLLNDHKCEYIVFEGFYSGIFPDPVFNYKNQKQKATDMGSFYVREQKHSPHHVRVVYPDSHKEDVRPLEPINRLRSRVKVFAYVLPPGQSAVLKNGKRFRPFEETLIWLIRVDITFDDGIHYRKKKR